MATKKSGSKSAAKRPAAKKTAAKKSPAKKTTAKKTAARKSVAKKTSAKKSPAKKTTAKKAPAKKATKSTAKKAKPGNRYAPYASSKVEAGMKAMKQGKLRSGSGQKVTNPKQAIAIELSEARKEGADVPPNPNESK